MPEKSTKLYQNNTTRKSIKGGQRVFYRIPYTPKKIIYYRTIESLYWNA